MGGIVSTWTKEPPAEDGFYWFSFVSEAYNESEITALRIKDNNVIFGGFCFTWSEFIDSFETSGGDDWRVMRIDAPKSYFLN